MKKFLLIFGLLCPIFLSGQESFSQIYGLEREYIMTTFLNIEVENDTLIFLGNATPVTPPQTSKQGVFFAKADTLGNLVEYHFHPDPDAGEFVSSQNSSLLKTFDGGYGLVGSEYYSNSACFVKLNHEGELEFYGKYDPAPDRQYFPRKALEVHNGYLIAGFKVLDNYDWSFFLIKIDKSGNFLWEKLYGQPDFDHNFGDMVLLDKNHIVLAGNKNIFQSQPYSPNLYNKSYMVHVDSLGIVLDEVVASDDLRTGFLGLNPVTDGWIYGVANFKYISQYSIENNIGIVRTGHDINDVKWELKIPNSSSPTDFIIDIKPTPDGHWVAAAQFAVIQPTSPPEPPAQVYQSATTLKFTSQGELLWMRSDTILSHPVFGVPYNHPGGIAVHPVSGSIFVAAYANNFGYTPYRSFAWLLKITPDGCIDTLCAMITSSTAPNPSQDYASNSLFVYPNPTTGPISWRATNDLLPPPNIASAEVFDALGRRLVHVRDPRGSLDLSALPSGLYRLVLRDDMGRVVLAQGVGKM